MIKTVSDLLTSLRDKEKLILDAEQISHPGTIGAMYEGLTAELLNFALPPSLAMLSVVSGFVTNLDGSKMSGQIDCMIVVGDGEQVPHTDVFKYSIDKVLAVFEVKKSSSKDNYLDAMNHLAQLSDLLPDYLPPSHLSDEATSRLIGYRPWHGDFSSLKREQDSFPFRSAIISTYLPLKVVVSYDGYKRDTTFPKIISVHLSESGVYEDFIGDFPDFVLDGNHGFIKLIGLPYATPVRNGVWFWFAKLENRPILSLLECIMWRLLPYTERDYPVFADHDLEPHMEAIFAATLRGKSIKIQPCSVALLPASQSFFEAENGIEVLEWEQKMLFMFTIKRMVNFDDIAKFVEQPITDVKRSVGRFCRKGILFVNNSSVSVNSSSMRSLMDGASKRFWVGEDCRGRFGRSQLRRIAGDEGEAIKVLHVITENNLDYTPISVAAFEVSAENAALLDIARYENMNRAQKLTEQDSE